MACTCACSFDSDDYAPACLWVRKPKARKAHVCVECGAEIKSGEVYERTSGVWDGRPDSFATCLPCARIREDICECAPFGHMREMIRDELGFDYVTGEE